MGVDLSPEVAWYYAHLKRPHLPRHLVAAMNATDFTLAAADNEFCHMVGHTEELRAARDSGMRWVSVEDRMCEWKTDMADIDQFIARTHRITEMLSNCRAVRITTADLSAVDPDDQAKNLTFSVSNASNGFISIASAPARPVTSFTQEDLERGQVLFSHDGSNSDTAKFDVVVADNSGAGSGAPQTVRVAVRSS